MDIRLDFPSGRAMAAALRALPRAVSGALMVTALMEGAVPIRDAAGALVRHRGPRRRPETISLADSIRIFPGARDATHATVEVGTKKPTAHLVEFGHRMVVGGKLGARRVLQYGPRKGEAIGGGRVVGFVPAYPFLRPAADENAETSVRLIGESLGEEIAAAAAQQGPHDAP